MFKLLNGVCFVSDLHAWDRNCRLQYPRMTPLFLMGLVTRKLLKKDVNRLALNFFFLDLDKYSGVPFL